MSFNNERALELKNINDKITNKYIERAKKGNGKALHILYEQYSKAMFNICVRMSSSFEDAEDILQEAFTDAFLNLHTYAYDASFGAWLKKIVINKCINALKKKRKELVFTNSNEEIVANEETNYNSLELEVEKVHKAIMKLPSGYKIVCSLYLLEGYDHREIAQILDISESTSKSQYMRAKKKLKEILVGDA